MTARTTDESFETVRGSRIVRLSNAEVYTINDNNGRSFAFREAVDKSWVVEESFPDPSFHPPLIGGPIDLRALASITRTDVLIAGFDKLSLPLGLDLSPVRAAPRAAWYSYGFLLQAAAAMYLDVDRNELHVGLRTVRDSSDGSVSGGVFLADALENGAGYAAFLGRPVEFEKLLRVLVDDIGPRWTSHQQGRQSCDTACYDCLKSYSNMAYHGLLDWRLALDMAEIANGRTLDTRRWLDRALDLCNQFCRDFEGWTPREFGPLTGAVHDEGHVLVLAHPLWSTHPAHYSNELGEAVVVARRAGFDAIHVHTLFDLVRRPVWVEDQVWGTL